MSPEPDRLYNLLPAVYRVRDAESGYALRDLLRVVGEQVEVVADDIHRLYDNWFIETCEDWVVPYIADLIGYRLVHDAGEPGPATTAEGRQLDQILVPRRDAANAIRNRRRKGTLALLAQLAFDVAGWPARAVEFDRLLVAAQSLHFPRPGRGRTVDLRRDEVLDRLGGPFDEVAHTVDVRRPNSHRTRGRTGLAYVGVFVWRLRAYPVMQAPAHTHDRHHRRYTFNVLGYDTPLFTRPVRGPGAPAVAGPMDVPAPIRLRAFRERLADYYGPGKSLQIYRDVPDANHAVPLDEIMVADLRDTPRGGWACEPRGCRVAVDPLRGRIAFGSEHPHCEQVWVTYHYGFGAEMGGGEYARPLRPPGTRRLYRVDPYGKPGPGVFSTISAALQQWHNDQKAEESQGKEPPYEAVIEVEANLPQTESIEVALAARESLEIRAASGRRPVIGKPDAEKHAIRVLRRGDPPGAGKRWGKLVLDGLLVTGRGLLIEGEVHEVVVRHCTLVPGWSLYAECRPRNPEGPSLELTGTTAALVVERSILGPIEVSESPPTTDPIRIEIRDSILDAMPGVPGSDDHALSSSTCAMAHAVLTILRSTVFGEVRTFAIDLAEDTLFVGRVRVARRRRGCMRFCSVALDSVTPRRYACQPDKEIAAEADRLGRPLDEAEQEQAAGRVRPRFNSVRYGRPDYAQLAEACPEAIRLGADDESEMGAFHDLFQPQREINLLARLDEFTPAGLDVGLFFAT